MGTLAIAANPKLNRPTKIAPYYGVIGKVPFVITYNFASKVVQKMFTGPIPTV